jgi:hypothetical protein
MYVACEPGVRPSSQVVRDRVRVELAIAQAVEELLDGLAV